MWFAPERHYEAELEKIAPSNCRTVRYNGSYFWLREEMMALLEGDEARKGLEGSRRGRIRLVEGGHAVLTPCVLAACKKNKSYAIAARVTSGLQQIRTLFQSEVTTLAYGSE